MGQERGPLSLVITTEELLERKSSGSDLENGDCGLGDSPRFLRDTPLSAEVGTNFDDKWRSLARHSSHAEAKEFFFLWEGWSECQIGAIT
jgi:hypothetical protein